MERASLILFLMLVFGAVFTLAQSVFVPTLSTSQQEFMDNAVGDTMLGDTTGLSNQMFNNFPNAQAERQMNQTFVGNKDKARYGTMLFPVIGAPGVVPVVQEVFGLAHVDGIPPGSLTGV